MSHVIRDRVAPPALAPLPRSYKVWLAAALGSQLGDVGLYFALAWAASAYGGAQAAAVVSAISLPRVVLLLVGGAVGDRVGARRVMVAGDAFMVIAAGSLAIGVLLWGAPLELLVATALLVGTVDAFYLPCSGSMPRRLVGADLLPRALALRQSGAQMVAVVGGPLGGVIVSAAGLSAAALFDAATFVGILVVMLRTPLRRLAPEGARSNVVRDALDGLRVAGTSDTLRAALLLAGGAAAFILPIPSILVPLLARSHHWGASLIGLTVGALAAGALGVSAAVARCGIRPHPGRTALVGLLVTCCGEALVGTSSAAGVAALGAAVMGVGNGLFVTHLGPILLMGAPAGHLARMQSLLVLVQSVALLAANNLLGNLARLIRPGSTILVSAGLLLGCTALGASTTSLRRAGAPAGAEPA